ncbi:MAG: NHL repeat-containing protein [Candidatus Omnitrophica bacterium]|nr:NHL repeat-containing protein [Candidatus Omnitrophota bacterium]
MNELTNKRIKLWTMVYGLSTILSLFSATAHAELTNDMSADVVIGQRDFRTTSAGTTQHNLNAPHGIFTDGQRLFVTEVNNNRVMIWNSIPVLNDAPADIVLGQAVFTTSAAGTGRSGLNGPRGVCYAGGKLFVADWGNNRILIWNTLPTVNNAPADVVVGQPDFDTVSSGVSQSKMYRPNMLHSDGKTLIVPDEYNNRVLIFKSIPVSNGAPADNVIGQADFTTNSQGTARDKIDRPNSLFFDSQRLFISEYDNNRILIYNSIPSFNGAPADIVLGQPDFTTSSSGLGPDRFHIPGKVFSDGKRLYVPDVNNNRILVWNNMPLSNGASADMVIGQRDFFSNGVNQGGSANANTISAPINVTSDGKRLIVSEFTTNNRALIYSIGGSSIKQGPQFDQGKALIGKVFNDVNGNGMQDTYEQTNEQINELTNKRINELTNKRISEPGIEGVKVVSDTGIYAITDSDGKYHFPYIEVGQHLLKIDESTLPEGSTITTDNPYHVTVTEGVLTKVSFAVKLPPERINEQTNKRINEQTNKRINEPLLKVSVSQDPVMLKPRLLIAHKIVTSEPTNKRTNELTNKRTNELIEFTITCNYHPFIVKSNIKLYDKDYNLIKTIDLPNPIPSIYTLPLNELTNQRTNELTNERIYYQLSVYDKNNKEDRTGVGEIAIK